MNLGPKDLAQPSPCLSVGGKSRKSPEMASLPRLLGTLYTAVFISGYHSRRTQRNLERVTKGWPTWFTRAYSRKNDQ